MRRVKGINFSSSAVRGGFEATVAKLLAFIVSSFSELYIVSVLGQYDCGIHQAYIMQTVFCWQYENQVSILGNWTNKGPALSRPKWSDATGKVCCLSVFIAVIDNKIVDKFTI